MRRENKIDPKELVKKKKKKRQERHEGRETELLSWYCRRISERELQGKRGHAWRLQTILTFASFSTLSDQKT